MDRLLKKEAVVKFAVTTLMGLNALVDVTVNKIKGMIFLLFKFEKFVIQ